MYQIVVISLLVSVVGGALYFSYSNGSVDTVHSLYENAPDDSGKEEDVSIEVKSSQEVHLEGFESSEPSNQ